MTIYGTITEQILKEFNYTAEEYKRDYPLAGIMKETLLHKLNQKQRKTVNIALRLFHEAFTMYSDKFFHGKKTQATYAHICEYFADALTSRLPLKIKPEDFSHLHSLNQNSDRIAEYLGRCGFEKDLKELSDKFFAYATGRGALFQFYMIMNNCLRSMNDEFESDKYEYFHRER